MPVQSISQTPDPVNLTLRQNQSWEIAFGYAESDGTTAISLAGYTPLLQFRTSALAKIASLTLEEGLGITFNPDTLPQVQISAGINCPSGKYEWDLRMIPADPTESIYLGRGVVQVDAEVSR